MKFKEAICYGECIKFHSSNEVNYLKMVNEYPFDLM